MKTKEEINNRIKKSHELLNEGQYNIMEWLSKQEKWDKDSHVFKEYEMKIKVQNTNNKEIKAYIDSLEWVLE